MTHHVQSAAVAADDELAVLTNIDIAAVAADGIGVSCGLAMIGILDGDNMAAVAASRRARINSCF